MEKPVSVVVSGVGGQGVLLTSEILGNAAMLSGLDVRVTETHGLSQRGGSLVSFVRIGKEVHSPLVDHGSADYMISMELLEALRSSIYSGGDTLHIVSTLEIPPVTVLSGKAKYPPSAEIRSYVASACRKAYFVDAPGMAVTAGKSLYQNVVLLGFFAGVTGGMISRKDFGEALKLLVPGRAVQPNLKAFDLGYQASLKGALLRRSAGR
ncbi:MAG TPA: indolepyruvate oxidoreductase subunit beta [Conexivisphaerales archaeon]|nr:indolepyruvate oxidoreductase subunit beta [Conexivisphaerales archaeon]